MKYILQGIKDYIKACWHDFWYWNWDSLSRLAFNLMKRTYCWRKNEGYYTKEGSLSHYIKQRKIAKGIKNNENN